MNLPIWCAMAMPMRGDMFEPNGPMGWGPQPGRSIGGWLGLNPARRAGFIPPFGLLGNEAAG